MLSANGGTTEGVFRNNDDRRYSFAGTATFAPDSTLSVRARSWALGGSARLPYVGNFMISMLNSALLGSSVDDPVRRGYRQFPLPVLELYDVDQRRRRLGGVVDATWTPARWLTVGALVGREDSRVDDKDDTPNIRALPNGTVLVEPGVSFRTAQNRNQRNSASVSASIAYGSSTFRGTTHLAGHYSRLDPEVSSGGQTTIDQQDLFALPLPRTVAIRLDAGW